jgi:DUF2917 family protein
MNANTLAEKIVRGRRDEPLARWLSAWWSARRASAPAGCGSWAVEDNRTLRLWPGRDGLLVGCDTGSVLVTLQGDPEDHVLEVGQELHVCGRGLVVVWALSNASVTVRPAHSLLRQPDRVGCTT